MATSSAGKYEVRHSSSDEENVQRHTTNVLRQESPSLSVDSAETDSTSLVERELCDSWRLSERDNDTLEVDMRNEIEQLTDAKLASDEESLAKAPVPSSLGSHSGKGERSTKVTGKKKKRISAPTTFPSDFSSIRTGNATAYFAERMKSIEKRNVAKSTSKFAPLAASIGMFSSAFQRFEFQHVAVARRSSLGATPPVAQTRHSSLTAVKSAEGTSSHSTMPSEQAKPLAHHPATLSLRLKKLPRLPYQPTPEPAYCQSDDQVDTDLVISQSSSLIKELAQESSVSSHHGSLSAASTNKSQRANIPVESSRLIRSVRESGNTPDVVATTLHESKYSPRQKAVSTDNASSTSQPSFTRQSLHTSVSLPLDRQRRSNGRQNSHFDIEIKREPLPYTHSASTESTPRNQGLQTAAITLGNQVVKVAKFDSLRPDDTLSSPSQVITVWDTEVPITDANEKVIPPMKLHVTRLHKNVFSTATSEPLILTKPANYEVLEQLPPKTNVISVNSSGGEVTDSSGQVRHKLVTGRTSPQRLHQHSNPLHRLHYSRRSKSQDDLLTSRLRTPMTSHPAASEIKMILLDGQNSEPHQLDANGRSTAPRQLDVDKESAESHRLDVDICSTKPHQLDVDRRSAEPNRLDVDRRSAELHRLEVDGQYTELYRLDVDRRSTKPHRLDVDRKSTKPRQLDVDRRSTELHQLDVDRRSTELHQLDVDRQSTKLHQLHVDRQSKQRYRIYIDRRNTEPHQLDVDRLNAEPNRLDVDRWCTKPHRLDVDKQRVEPNQLDVYRLSTQPNQSQNQPHVDNAAQSMERSQHYFLPQEERGDIQQGSSNPQKVRAFGSLNKSSVISNYHENVRMKSYPTTNVKHGKQMPERMEAPELQHSGGATDTKELPWFMKQRGAGDKGSRLGASRAHNRPTTGLRSKSLPSRNKSVVITQLAQFFQEEAEQGATHRVAAPLFDEATYLAEESEKIAYQMKTPTPITRRPRNAHNTDHLATRSNLEGAAADDQRPVPLYHQKGSSFDQEIPHNQHSLSGRALRRSPENTEEISKCQLAAGQPEGQHVVDKRPIVASAFKAWLEVDKESSTMERAVGHAYNKHLSATILPKPREERYKGRFDDGAQQSSYEERKAADSLKRDRDAVDRLKRDRDTQTVDTPPNSFQLDIDCRNSETAENAEDYGQKYSPYAHSQHINSKSEYKAKVEGHYAQIKKKPATENRTPVSGVDMSEDDTQLSVQKPVPKLEGEVEHRYDEGPQGSSYQQFQDYLMPGIHSYNNDSGWEAAVMAPSDIRPYHESETLFHDYGLPSSHGIPPDLGILSNRGILSDHRIPSDYRIPLDHGIPPDHEISSHDRLASGDEWIADYSHTASHENTLVQTDHHRMDYVPDIQDASHSRWLPTSYEPDRQDIHPAYHQHAPYNRNVQGRLQRVQPNTPSWRLIGNPNANETSLSVTEHQAAQHLPPRTNHPAGHQLGTNFAVQSYQSFPHPSQRSLPSKTSLQRGMRWRANARHRERRRLAHQTLDKVNDKRYERRHEQSAGRPLTQQRPHSSSVRQVNPVGTRAGRIPNKGQTTTATKPSAGPPSLALPDFIPIHYRNERSTQSLDRGGIRGHHVPYSEANAYQQRGADPYHHHSMYHHYQHQQARPGVAVMCNPDSGTSDF